uniref:Uncharacterized protein n=1 Tax=Arundo donax TaxID=35708 RepID=A0A0A8YM10_ARUDO
MTTMTSSMTTMTSSSSITCSL